MRRFLLALAVVAVPLVAGCWYHHHGYVSGPVVTVGHIHGSGCGHVYANGGWYDPSPSVVYVHDPGPRVYVGPTFHHHGHGWFGPRVIYRGPGCR